FRRVCGPYSAFYGNVRCRRLFVHAEDVAPRVPHVDGAATVPRQFNDAPLGSGSRVHRHGLAVLAPDGERPVVRVKDIDGLAVHCRTRPSSRLARLTPATTPSPPPSPGISPRARSVSRARPSASASVGA